MIKTGNTTIDHASKSSTAIVRAYQRECTISNSNRIATASVGPCYALTGHDPQTKYSFLAHIDDMTEVESINSIFQRLTELGVDKNNLINIRLIGGWKSERSSNAWGVKIVEVLKAQGIYNQTNFNCFQTKAEYFGVPAEEDLPLYYYPGGIMDPKKGDFQFFGKSWGQLENEGMAQMMKRYNVSSIEDLTLKMRIDMNLYPLTIKVVE